MHTSETAELVCRHGTALQSCSICQPSLSRPHEAFAGTLDERVESARPRLLRVARLNGIGPDEAEDVVQETFLEAWRHLEKLREPERFAAWLDGICRNVCKRHIRAQASLLQTSELRTSLGEAEASAFDLPDPLAIDPCTGYLDHPFKNRHCETEKDLHPLLANTGESVYNQISSTASSCSKDDTLT